MAKSGKDKKKHSDSPRILNRKARHDYHIVESLEVGIVLGGAEVKSVRMGRASIGEAYALVDPRSREIWIHNLDISAYDHAGDVAHHEPKRKRKLLAHKREIERLFGLTTAKGVTLIPLAMYFNERGIIKVELAVATGKQHADKRDDIKKRDSEKRIRQAMTRKRL